jgi:hypothetical protein
VRLSNNMLRLRYHSKKVVCLWLWAIKLINF